MTVGEGPARVLRPGVTALAAVLVTLAGGETSLCDSRWACPTTACSMRSSTFVRLVVDDVRP